MKPGNESLLFSWWARLVAMDPKTKIGLWLFGEVGGGFSELYLTLRPGWGLVLKLGGLTEDRRFALAVGHHWYSTSSPASAAEGCAQGQCEQEEQRQDVSPRPLRGGEPPASGNGKWLRSLGAIHGYITDSPTHLHLQTEQKNKDNYLSI